MEEGLEEGTSLLQIFDWSIQSRVSDERYRDEFTSVSLVETRNICKKDIRRLSNTYNFTTTK